MRWSDLLLMAADGDPGEDGETHVQAYAEQNHWFADEREARDDDVD